MNRQRTHQAEANFDRARKPLSDREFLLFQKLIYRAAGIYLSDAKKALVEGRLSRRVRELGMSSFSAYYEYLSSEKSGAEVGEMLDRISTNETHFFREPRQFAFLDQQVFPEWQAQATRVSRSKRIRVWSAGCSTGEEPYSIAMILLDHFPPRTGWQIEILATDLSQRALRAARTAVWPIGKAKQIPPKYLKQFMLRGTGAQAGNMKAGTELTALVRFEQLNLNDSVPPWLEHFDLIFCRNVLIYFDARSRARVIHRLVDTLMPDGYLLVGHAESLTGMTNHLQYAMPTVYRRALSQPAERVDTQPWEASSAT
ncbi:MAG: chemotaxis protein methyltransferase CheR [Candidatus Binatota bacterium]|jgi:chemotaxis protein methyltransferase CheR|nr:chemotaxis protein methyltransferase CheR [Candidatus Binatota bacterium]